MSRFSVKYLRTAEAARVLDMTPQRVRQLIEEKVIPAVRVGKGWDTTEDAAALTERLGKKGKHRVRRAGFPRLIGLVADGCYWTRHHYRACEAARIARQRSGSTGYHMGEDGHPRMEFRLDSVIGTGERDGVLYYKVSNPGVTAEKDWEKIDQVTSRFFMEQGCDPVSGQRRPPSRWDRNQ
jgi:excisionase family DNA binding protein